MMLAAASRLMWLGLAALAISMAAPLALGEEVSRATSRQDGASLFAAALIDLSNQPENLSAYRGKPLVINFWARWCGPCKVEIPELVSLQKRNTGVAVVGLNIENNSASVRDFAYAYDINYPVFLTRETGLALMQTLGNRKTVLPFTVVLNRHGDVVSTHIGAMTREKLDEAVLLALKPVPERGGAP